MTVVTERRHSGIATFQSQICSYTTRTFILCIVSLLCWPTIVSGFTSPGAQYHRIYHANNVISSIQPPIQFRSSHIIQRAYSSSIKLSNSISNFSMEEIPLNQIFQKAVVLQRSGDRDGALVEYQQFLKVAASYDVDPSLYVSKTV